jgi:outer membrane autotransporter protein
LGDNPRRYAEPFVALAYASLRDGGWRETGGEAAIETRSARDSATFATAGLRWSAKSGAAQWYGTLGWRHAFGFERATARQSFVQGGNDFSVQGLPLARDAALVELGAGFAIAPHARVTAAYTGLLGSGARDHGANLRLVVDL